MSAAPPSDLHPSATHPRADHPVVVHSARVVVPMTAPPIADGAVAVHHALVPDVVLALGAGAAPAELRVLGADAARIVTGLPLRTARNERLLAGIPRSASDTIQ